MGPRTEGTWALKPHLYHKGLEREETRIPQQREDGNNGQHIDFDFDWDSRKSLSCDPNHVACVKSVSWHQDEASITLTGTHEGEKRNSKHYPYPVWKLQFLYWPFVAGSESESTLLKLHVKMPDFTPDINIISAWKIPTKVFMTLAVKFQGTWRRNWNLMSWEVKWPGPKQGTEAQITSEGMCHSLLRSPVHYIFA